MHKTKKTLPPVFSGGTVRIGIFMNGEKAAKNRTIDTSPEAGGGYLARCARIEAPVCKENIENKIAFGDTFCVMPLLPRALQTLS